MGRSMVLRPQTNRQGWIGYNRQPMAWLKRFVVGLALGAVVLYIVHRPPADAGKVVADFAHHVDGASVRRPRPEVFTAADAVVGGLEKSVIAVSEPRRIAWDLEIPGRAWLEVSLALREEAWSAPGDGVLFRVGISFDGRYQELVTRVVNPRDVEADRGWIPVGIDLSPFAGKQASVIFNTGAGLSGDNRDNDHALWGEPRVVIR